MRGKLGTLLTAFAVLATVVTVVPEAAAEEPGVGPPGPIDATTASGYRVQSVPNGFGGAVEINNQGKVVLGGQGSNLGANPSQVWLGNGRGNPLGLAIQDFGVPTASHEFSDINNFGVVAGRYQASNGLWLGFLWSESGGFDPTGFGGLNAQLVGIDDSGNLVGYSNTSPDACGNPSTGICMYYGDTDGLAVVPDSHNRIPLDVGGGRTVGNETWTEGGGFVGLPTTSVVGQGRAINESGQIAGFVGDGSGTNIAAYWSSPANTPTEIGVLPGLGHIYSIAIGINENGDVVGWSGVGGGSNDSRRAFKWSPPAGPMIDLGLIPGGTTASAFDINDDGLAVGTADDSDGVNRAVIWDTGTSDYDINYPPHLVSGMTTITVDEGNLASLPLTFDDFDGDPIAVSLIGAPPGASWDQAGEQVLWQTSVGDAGTHQFRVRAAEADTENELLLLATITVTTPLVLDPIGDQTVTADSQLELTMSSNGQFPFYSVFQGAPPNLSTLPGWATLAGDRLSLAPQTGDEGTYQLTAIVQAGQQQDTETFTVTVAPALGTGAVRGQTWEDTDGDGLWDQPSEPSMTGVVVYHDLNDNGVHDSGEPTDTSTPNWTFGSLPAGTHVFRQITPTGHTQTYPGGDGAQRLTLTTGELLSGIDFGNQPSGPTTGSIAGAKWEDTNGNGALDPGEPPIAGVTIYLDSDGDNILDPGEPSTTTDGLGEYSFAALSPGGYVVSEVVPNGYSQTFPATGNGSHNVSLDAGEVLTNLDFGNQPNAPATGSIIGFKWEDTNGNGALDPGEPPIAGVTIYLDSDGDNTLDPGEPTTTTDEFGEYVFTGLDAGGYLVREIVPPGYTLTFPLSGDGSHDVILSPGENLIGIDFGNHPTPPQPITINITEGVGIADSVAVIPPVSITVLESVSVADDVTLEVIPAGADIALTVLTPEPVTSINGGESVVFNTLLSNNGPATATAVLATIDFPGPVVITDLDPSCGFDPSTQAVFCGFGALGGPQPIQFTATFPTGGDQIVAYSVVADESDPDPTNNTDSVLIQVTSLSANTGATAFLLDGDNPLGQILSGNEITLRFVASNHGIDPATGVTGAIAMPADWTVTDAPGGCLVNDNATTTQLDCPFSDLPAPSIPAIPTTTSFDVVVETGASGDVTLSVQSDQSDPVPGNDMSNLPVTTLEHSVDFSVSEINLVHDEIDYSFGTGRFEAILSAHLLPTATDATTPVSPQIDIEISPVDGVIEDQVTVFSGDCVETGRDTSIRLTCTSDFESQTWEDDFAVRLFVDEVGDYTITASVIDDDVFETDFSNNSITRTVTASPPPPISLRSIEVNQVVQDWTNSVELFRGKDTLVRVFLEGTNNQRTSGRLIGLDASGTPLTGSPLEPISTNPRSLRLDATVDRQNMFNSFNFVLPEAWTQQPGLQLAFELADEGPAQAMICNEPDGSPDCSVGVSLTVPVVPEIDIVSAGYTNSSGTDVPALSLDELQEELRRLKAALPYATADVRILWLEDFDDHPTVDDVNAALDAYRILQDSQCPSCRSDDLVVGGYLIGSSSDEWGGVSTGPVYSSFTSNPSGVAPNPSYAYSRGVHELAHSYGKAHAVFQTSADGENTVGVCGSKAVLEAELHPWMQSIGIGNPDPDRPSGTPIDTWPTIGPLDAGPDSEIWAVNTRGLTDSSLTTIIDPRANIELMSYCDLGTRWPSDFTYRRVAEGFAAGPRADGEDTSDLVGDAVVITGTIHPDGTFEVKNTVRASGEFTVPLSGELEASFVDSTGTALSTAPVSVHVPDGGDPDTPGLADGTPPRTFATILPVPVANIASLVFLDGATALATVDASANAPTLIIEQPTAGAVVSDELSISWTAADSDGDPLSASVAYSADGGATWQILAVSTSEESLSIPADRVAESASALVRVSVTDGIHHTEAISDPFTVGDSGPIDSDSDGLTDAEEALTGTHPANPDTDGDGLIDGLDASWLIDYLSDLPRSDFKRRWHRGAMKLIVGGAAIAVNLGEGELALAITGSLHKRVDGCGSQPDRSDWIVECEAQLGFRTLLDLYERGVATLPLPYPFGVE